MIWYIFNYLREGIWACDFSSDGNNFISGSPDKTIKIWDAKKTKSSIKVLSGHTGHVYCSRYNETNTQIASSGADSDIIIWDLRKGDAVKRISGINILAK